MPARSTARLTALAATTCAALLLGLTGTASAADTLNCDDFTYQEQAQAIFDQDRTDPNHLDGGQNGPGDGVACESLPHRPGADTTEPSTDEPETVEEPDTSHDDTTTPDDTTRPDDTSTPEDTTTTETPTTTAAEAVAPAPTADRDCADFPTQAEAQAALAPGDPERLDADSDGIACEQQFGTENQQVAVHPVGGVATGGTPLR
jgi:hypothetical protein